MSLKWQLQVLTLTKLIMEGVPVTTLYGFLSELESNRATNTICIAVERILYYLLGNVEIIRLESTCFYGWLDVILCSHTGGNLGTNNNRIHLLCNSQHLEPSSIRHMTEQLS